MLSSESNNTNTLLSMSYNFTVATDEIWTIDVPDSFVNVTVEACIWASEWPTTLNEPDPNIHIKPPLVP
jgi:hypothetical protein